MSSQLGTRLNYRTAFAAVQQAGINPATAILTQSFLRLEVILSTTKTNYQFGVVVNDAPQGQPVLPTEQRLNLQDSFFVTTVQMYLSLLSATTDTNYYPITYPNPRLFSTLGASTALNNLYNGYLSLIVNNRVITTAWDLMRHLEIPETQQTTAPVAAGIPLDELSGARMTSFPCEPNWVLIGSKNNVLQIQLPAAISVLQASAQTKLTLLLRGILAQNVTPVT